MLKERRFLSPEHFENLNLWNFSETTENKGVNFPCDYVIFKENLKIFTWKFNGFYKKI